MAELLMGGGGALARAPRDLGGRASENGAIDLLRVAAADAAGPLLAVVEDGAGSGQVAWANAASLELLGLAADELIDQALECVDALRGGDPTDWSVAVAAALRGSPSSSAATVARPDGSRVAVRVEVSVAGESGWVVRLHRVVNAEQAAEQARRESEHRFRALAEHAPVGIVVSEIGVRLGFVNDRFVNLAGLDASRLLGARWLDVIHPEDLPGLLEDLQVVLSGEPMDRTVRMLTASDGPRWVQVRLAPVTTPSRAAGFVGTIEDITVRRAWETQLAYQASHDPLTGLANRRRLVETLTDLLDSRRARDLQFAVLFCDLDRFKHINDTLGHHAGDRVLIEVGRRLTVIAREHDLVARIAGDEFVILVAQIRDSREAEAAAARYLAQLAVPVHVSGQDLPISASIGVALPNAASTPQSLLTAADRGMYQAKSAGPGNYRLAVPVHDEP